MLFLMGASTGAAYAVSNPGITDVKIAQQDGACTGIVKDATGETVIGASVVVKGTTNGTITGIDGDFSLSNVKKGDILQISFVGYITQEVKWNGTPLNIILKDDTQTLEEVVVVGYGTQKKVNLTGAVAMAESDVLEDRPIANLAQGLQGAIPNLNISFANGNPNSSTSINVRGLTSLNGGSALILVDGVETNDISLLNPQDIESISVLKDASSTAVYGSSGANGVVIITTKRGARNQDAKVTYNGYVGIQKATNLLEMCNSHEYATMLMEADAASYGHIFEKSIETFGGDLNALKFNADTNWYDELLRTAMMTNHSLNVSGGTEKATYSAGMSYLSQDGIMDVDNYYRRLNFRAALDSMHAAG